MKKLIILYLIAIVAIEAGAQDIDLKGMKTPSSPAFQLLDIAPSSIERPTNPKKLAVNLYSLTNSGTALPKNFAFEFSPYWFTRPQDMNVYKYLNIANENKRYLFNGIYQKLSISAVSSYSDSTTGSLLMNTNYYAVGARTNLLTFRTDQQNKKMGKVMSDISNSIGRLKENKDTKNRLKGSMMKLRATRSALQENLRKAMADDKAGIGTQEQKDARKAAIAEDQATVASIDAQIGAIQTKIDAMDELGPEELEKAIDNDQTMQCLLQDLEAPPLIQVNGAYAYSQAIPGNAYANKRFNRSGFWLDATIAGFAKSENKITHQFFFTGALRFVNDNLLADTTKNIFVRKDYRDVGFRFEYIVSDFSFSIEHLKRTYHDAKDLGSERTVGTISYKIAEGAYVTGSFGKNFGEGDNLFTLFGINWGFGKTAATPTSFVSSK